MLRLDFSSGSYQGPDDLRLELAAQLETLEEEAAVAARPDVPVAARFRRLIQALHRQAGQPVAVLVDEYDKPILDALDVPDIARANRDLLRGLYSMVKFADADIRFTFIAGISRSPRRGSARGDPSHETASKVSLFSGLNNLKDLTLDPRYSAICGYTEADLNDTFAPELPGLDRDRIREWYYGYS